MKTLAVAGLAGLLAIVALAAYGGMDTTASRDESKRKPVADDAGNLRVPDAYRKDGRFPDGTVLVKEVFQTATGDMTTGTVSHAETLKGWFVMMKDSKGRHAGNKLWGDGWGWSWFDADSPSKTTSTDYKTDCQSCHVPARASDWIYVSGYPPLRDSKSTHATKWGTRALGTP